MSTLTSAPNRSERVVAGKLWQAGLIAAVTATIANLILWQIEIHVLSLELNVFAQGPGTPLMPVSPIMIILTTAVPAIIATLFLAILDRVVARPFRIFQIIAVVFLLLSLGGPFGLPAEVALSAKLGLSLMHIVAGGVIVWALNKYGRS